MKQFNHRRAWQEVAAPAFGGLAPEVKALYEVVAERTTQIWQQADLEVACPDEVKEMFRALPSAVLAYAARVIYCHGHWGQAGEAKDGNYWKFSHLADQVLRERMQVARRAPDNKRGQVALGLQLIEGTIRVTRSADDSWGWLEVALATEANLQKVRELLDRHNFGGVQAACEQAELLGPKDGLFARLVNTGEFVEEC